MAGRLTKNLSRACGKHGVAPPFPSPNPRPPIDFQRLPNASTRAYASAIARCSTESEKKEGDPAPLPACTPSRRSPSAAQHTSQSLYPRRGLEVSRPPGHPCSRAGPLLISTHAETFCSPVDGTSSLHLDLRRWNAKQDLRVLSHWRQPIFKMSIDEHIFQKAELRKSNLARRTHSNCQRRYLPADRRALAEGHPFFSTYGDSAMPLREGPNTKRTSRNRSIGPWAAMGADHHARFSAPAIAFGAGRFLQRPRNLAWWVSRGKTDILSRRARLAEGPALNAESCFVSLLLRRSPRANRSGFQNERPESPASSPPVPNPRSILEGLFVSRAFGINTRAPLPSLRQKRSPMKDFHPLLVFYQRGGLGGFHGVFAGFSNPRRALPAFYRQGGLVKIRRRRTLIYADSR